MYSLASLTGKDFSMARSESGLILGRPGPAESTKYRHGGSGVPGGVRETGEREAPKSKRI
jgi:hypothetical protein